MGAILERASERLVEQATTDGQASVHLLKEQVTARLPSGGDLSLMRKRLPGRPSRAALLLVHGFGTNRYTWHLDQRSLSAWLASRGYDVFNLELRGIGRSRALGAPSPVSFDEHVEVDLPAALDAVQACGHERVFLLGHSLGGAAAYAVSPRERQRIAGVITLSGVFRWGKGTRALGALARVVHGCGWVHRKVGASNGVPILLEGLGRLLARGVRVVDRGWVPLPAEAWAPGSVEHDVLREWLTRAFDRTSGGVLNTLGRMARTGAFRNLAGDRDYGAEWAACGVPVLVLGGDRDLLAHPYEDVRPAYEASSARDRTYYCFGPSTGGLSYGHIDLLIGRQAPDEVWPRIANWLDART